MILKSMKKKRVKRVFKCSLLLIFAFCFVLLFARNSIKSYASVQDDAYDVTQQYFEYMQANQQAILSQFYTYAYVSVVYRNVTYNYCCNVTNIQAFDNRTVYVCGSATCYYAGSALPVVSNQTITVYPDFIRVSGRDFYYDSTQHPNYVIYCDLPSESYSNPNDSSSLQPHTLNVVPPVSFGYISHQSGDYDDNISDTLQRWKPAIVTTLPPATLPPWSPAVTVTLPPAETDINSSYVIDYSPYINADAYSPPMVSANTNIVSDGVGIISYCYDLLSSADFYSTLLLLMIISFCIYLII